MQHIKKTQSNYHYTKFEMLIPERTQKFSNLGHS